MCGCGFHAQNGRVASEGNHTPGFVKEEETVGGGNQGGATNLLAAAALSSKGGGCLA